MIPISNPKTEHLLDATLEPLHTESRQWLNEIAFWSEQMSFFYKLIHMREPHIDFPTPALAELERELIKIISGALSEVKTSAEKHERLLSIVERTFSPDKERAYRDEHRRLVHAMYDLQGQIRTFKQRVYSFA